MMESLFATNTTRKKPLADRMRPQRLDDFVGQEKAVGKGSPLRRMIEKMLCRVCFFMVRRVPARPLWQR